MLVNGTIQLARKDIFDRRLDLHQKGFYLVLVAMANIKPGTVSLGGAPLTIQRGQVLASQTEIGRMVDRGRVAVNRLLAELAALGCIRIETVGGLRRKSLITIHGFGEQRPAAPDTDAAVEMPAGDGIVDRTLPAEQRCADDTVDGIAGYSSYKKEKNLKEKKESKQEYPTDGTVAAAPPVRELRSEEVVPGRRIVFEGQSGFRLNERDFEDWLDGFRLKDGKAAFSRKTLLGTLEFYDQKLLAYSDRKLREIKPFFWVKHSIQADINAGKVFTPSGPGYPARAAQKSIRYAV